MKKTGTGLGAGAVLLAWSGWILFAGTSTATLPMQKKAKELGYPATNCLYCHVDKLPKKDAHKFNERGQWLVDQKEKRKAKEVDAAWLKEYVEKKK